MHFARIAPLAFLLFVAQACGGSDDPKNDATKPTTKTVTLTGDGATVELDGATVVFPSGAVTGSQEITASVVTTPPVAIDGERSFVSTIVKLLPHDFALQAPALVTVRRTSSASGTLRYVRLADENATAWTDEGPAAASGDDITFTLTRFSFDGVASMPTSCTPDCGTRVCGTESSCGLSCGSCAVTASCTSAGACVPNQPNCVPTCNGAECGLDSTCGVSCGTCDFTQTCSATGVCEGEACVPRSCDGVSCGSNGCDGYCGAGCTDGTVCGGGACVDTWSEETSPCANQPLGSIMPMSGGCAERGYRTAFELGGGTGLTRAWSWRPPNAVAFGSRTFYSPVVDDRGTIYVASLNALYAVVDVGDFGRTVWRVTPADLGDANQGIVSPPVVVDGTVIVVTKDGKVHARNATDGSEKWTRAMGAALTYVPVLPAVLSDRVMLYGNEKMWSFAVSNGNVLMERAYFGDNHLLDLSLRGNLLIGGSVGSNYILAFDYAANTDYQWSTYGQLYGDVPATFLSNGHVLFAGYESPQTKLFDVTPPASLPGSAVVKKILPPAAFGTVRLALNKNDVALVTNGGVNIATTSHCLMDLTATTPTCVSVTPAQSAPVRSQPLALRDGSFVIVDIDGRVSRVGTDGVIDFNLLLETAVVPSPSSPDVYYSSPAIGADGTLYVTFGGGEGELHAVRMVPVP